MIRCLQHSFSYKVTGIKEEELSIRHECVEVVCLSDSDFSDCDDPEKKPIVKQDVKNVICIDVSDDDNETIFNLKRAKLAPKFDSKYSQTNVNPDLSGCDKSSVGLAPNQVSNITQAHDGSESSNYDSVDVHGPGHISTQCGPVLNIKQEEEFDIKQEAIEYEECESDHDILLLPSPPSSHRLESSNSISGPDNPYSGPNPKQSTHFKPPKSNKYKFCATCDSLENKDTAKWDEHMLVEHYCSLCHREFASLHRHNYCVHRKYYCSQCRILHKNVVSLKKHVEADHSDELCLICRTYRGVGRDLHYHKIKKHGDSYCTQCRVLFMDAPSLNLHNKETHKDTFCPICNYFTYAFNMTLHQHHVSKHKDCYCPDCRLLLSDSNDFNAHKGRCTVTVVKMNKM